MLLNGDCLEEMSKISDQSIDLILADLPYGTTECDWDEIISMVPMWKEFWRVSKPRAAIILFGNFPFSSFLVNSELKNFRYSLVWKKSRVSRFAQANHRPLNEHEDLLVFSKAKCSANSRLKMVYNPQGVIDIAPKTSIYKAHSLRKGRSPKTRTTSKTNYPRSILEFASESRPLHPTSKPVALLEYLIKTYTNTGGIVLDPCMGCGPTGVAALNLGRNFIGIEKDPGYFEIAKKRILK